MIFDNFFFIYMSLLLFVGTCCNVEQCMLESKGQRWIHHMQQWWVCEKSLFCCLCLTHRSRSEFFSIFFQFDHQCHAFKLKGDGKDAHFTFWSWRTCIESSNSLILLLILLLCSVILDRHIGNCFWKFSPNTPHQVRNDSLFNFLLSLWLYINAMRVCVCSYEAISSKILCFTGLSEYGTQKILRKIKLLSRPRTNKVRKSCA